MNKEVLLSAHSLSKTFFRENARLDILKAIDLEVKEGEMLCIQGASGTGKSTLLHLLGTLDKPTAGAIRFRGERIDDSSEEKLADFRLKNLGFVFQFHQLMSEFTALENVLIPCRIAGMSPKLAKEAAKAWIERLGMLHRLDHYPSELSGGEQQRLAIARALVLEPKLLMADEPTGNLDSKNTKNIRELLFELNREHGIAVVLVTHDNELASHFPRRKNLVDGSWEKPNFDLHQN